ncbi:RPS17C, partial [Symbiodinium sp. KB8]
GRVRTKTIKRSARLIVEKYYTKLAQDFDSNKKVCDEVAVVPSKRVRNKIAGFEEERERRLDFVPKESALKVAEIKVDKDTRAMLKKLGCNLDVGDADVRRDRAGNRRGFRKGGDRSRRPRTGAAAGPVGSNPAK